MSVFFTPHARDRAKEHYGLDLTVEDMSAIIKDCVKGRAFLGLSCPEGHTYIALFNGKRIIPHLSPDKAMIVTFMPSGYFTAGSKRRWAQKKGVVKQNFAVARGATQDTYRRKKIKPIDILMEKD